MANSNASLGVDAAADAGPVGAGGSPPLLTVTVVFSPSQRVVHELTLQLPAGSTVQQALDRVKDAADFAAVDWANLQAGIWNRPASAQQLLQMQDRLELYRPLRVDPKVARRERFAQQGARTAGLFALRRQKDRLGSKPGY